MLNVTLETLFKKSKIWIINYLLQDQVNMSDKFRHFNNIDVKNKPRAL